MYRRFSPYYRHTIHNVNERRRVQERLLTSFNEKPVTPLSATCAVCLETYVMQSNNIVEFLMPINCTHMFCYKCVLGIYSNAMNVPRAIVRCPMCQETVTTWQSFFPNTVVSCKFIKKTADRVPSCQQFSDAVGILKKRYAPLTEDVPNNEGDLREQLNRVQQEKTAELQRLQSEKAAELRRLKAAHDAAWESSCSQIASLQKRVTSLETKNEWLQRQNEEYVTGMCDNHIEKQSSKTKIVSLQAEVTAANTKISSLEEKDNASAKTIADLTQTVQRLKSELASKSAVTIEFNRNTNTALHQRFNSLLDSTFENMMLKDRIMNLRRDVFGAACGPCHVNIDIKCSGSGGSNDDDLILIEDHNDTITIDD
ncbi:PE38 protein [Choristoneura diversana nucleopolyhedrovirus]|nr:PE38 protein [Choristoneura diversana nucleopolyhedrovirus]